MTSQESDFLLNESDPNFLSSRVSSPAFSHSLGQNMNTSGDASRKFNTRTLSIVDMDQPFGIKLKKMFTNDTENEIVMEKGAEDFEMP